MKTGVRNKLLLMLCLYVLFSCEKPREDYRFININPEIDSTRLFIFDFNLDNPELIYNTAISCRYIQDMTDNKTLTLYVTAVSPSGKYYSETVNFPLYSDKKQIKNNNEVSIRRNGKIIDIQWAYRNGIRAGTESGLWKINIKIENENAAKGIFGIGFKYKGYYYYENK